MINIINELASTSSRNTKIEILTREYNNELLKTVFLHTYSPMIQYYIEKIPEYSKNDIGIISLEDAIHELKQLSSREKTGNDGIQALKELLESVSPEDSIIIERIIDRDMRCGVGASTINKVWKDLIPEKAYCRCSPLKDMKKNDLHLGYFTQTKLDGSFLNIDVAEKSVDFFTRNGKLYDTKYFKQIHDELLSLDSWNYELHGEALIKRDGKILNRETGNGIFNSYLSGEDIVDGDEVFIQVWDIIPLRVAQPKGTYSVDYSKRFDMLQDIISKCKHISIVDTEVLYDVESIKAKYKKAREAGEEGLVIKAPYMTWKDGTSREQFKLKAEVIVDLEIIGFTEGEGKNKKTFGSIQTKSSDDILYVDVSGISDELRLKIHNNREYYIGKIMAVKANAITSNKNIEGKMSLFLPRHVEIREDKNTANTYEEIVKEFESSLDKLEFPF